MTHFNVIKHPKLLSSDFKLTSNLIYFSFWEYYDDDGNQQWIAGLSHCTVMMICKKVFN